MPRPLRLEAEGAIYHVIARGNERKLIFRDDDDRREYLDRLIRCRERFGLGVLAYCLMGNHLHLAVERGATKLSRVMLALQSAYTQWFNRRHDRVGHLFQGRYKAFVIEKDRYLLALVRYIHRNPVEAGLARRPQDYPWSSDRYYRRGQAPEWLDVDDVLPLLGQSRRVAVARYRRLMGGEVEETYESLKAYAQAIKGDDRQEADGGKGRCRRGRRPGRTVGGSGKRKPAEGFLARPTDRGVSRSCRGRDSCFSDGEVLRQGGVNLCSGRAQTRGEADERSTSAQVRRPVGGRPPKIIQEVHG